MKSFLKHFTFFLLTAVTVCFFSACDDLFSHVSNSSGTGVYGDFHYSYGPSTVTITRYTGSGGNVIIPAVIDGKPVTALEHDGTFFMGSVFFDCLTSVTIPDSVTYIGNRAFARNQLTSVVIPNSVTYIGTYAFWDNQLTSVTIGSSVISIGKSAFEKNQLTSVVIPNSVTTIGSMAFALNQLTSVTIGSGVTDIGNLAFSNSIEGYATVNPLTNITVVPGNTVYVSKNSFLLSKDEKQIFLYYGSGKNIVIPGNITSIRAFAFYGHPLTSVVIPNSVTAIEYGVFFYNELTSITIGANVTLGNATEAAGSFGNGFEKAYDNTYSKAAGTYTRPDTNIGTAWTKN
jgi:hypothetical protein